MKGKRIATLAGIERACKRRRAVWYTNYRRPVAAAFVMSMQARLVSQMLRIGLYEYRPATQQARATR